MLKAQYLADLQDALGYQFSDVSRLQQALVHASSDGADNERLEFLGDSVLSYVVSTLLFHRTDDATVGTLTVQKSQLVSNAHLAEVARNLGIDRQLLVGESVREEDEKSTKMCADALEAVLGAIALDGGVEPVLTFVQKHIMSDTDVDVVAPKHAKSILQELVAAQGLELPKYDVVSHQPDAAEKTWQVRCEVEALDLIGTGMAGTKREAERQAAEEILNRMSHAA